jgi:hypothetical protein
LEHPAVDQNGACFGSHLKAGSGHDPARAMERYLDAHARGPGCISVCPNAVSYLSAKASILPINWTSADIVAKRVMGHFRCEGKICLDFRMDAVKRLSRAYFVADLA